ncbi:G protein-regulated inducer of neurite outgrowth 1 [Dermochelys coriacea]|uniref:G protein-regulated inducer of neurite outgrowth 1 n=1 Tax=Dermochelys coriacea TaxID=27794 RepID=UPI0018E7F92F|nr:G protein-regulated inducer of neurite outgrowth 1 [Dermochelys coriacea]
MPAGTKPPTRQGAPRGQHPRNGLGAHRGRASPGQVPPPVPSVLPPVRPGPSSRRCFAGSRRPPPLPEIRRLPHACSQLHKPAAPGTAVRGGASPQPDAGPGLPGAPADPRAPGSGIAWASPGQGMGSAKEPESLQLLAQEGAAEDGCSPCRQQASGYLPNSRCGASTLAMRNCCGTEPSGPEPGSQGSTESRAEAPAMAQQSEPEPAAGGWALALKGPGAGAGPLEKQDERTHVAVSCLGQNGERSSGPLALPHGSVTRQGPPAGEGAAVPSPGPLFPRLLPEPCLKGHSRDPVSALAALKHVFLEPANTDPEPDGAVATALSPELGPVPPMCLQDQSQEQPGASEGAVSRWSVGAPGAAPLPDGGLGTPCGDAGGKAPVSLAESKAQLGPPAAPGAGGNRDMALPSPPEGTKDSTPGTETASGPGARLPAGPTPSGQAKETSPPAPLSIQKAGPVAPSVAAPIKSGASRAAPAEAGGGAGPAQSTAERSPAQEQWGAMEMEVGPGEEAAQEPRTVELLSKTYSFEVTPPPQDAGTQDAGTQVGSRVSLVSVAISPINPPDGSSAFTFHSRGQGPSGLKSPGPELKPSKKDAEMQVSIPLETRSVATGPMTPVAKSPQAPYPEVHVKGAQEEPPEPIREVSWDEKGMTWEVYGAAMEVEVLGMAIQKHLEKQIEEHGRQVVMTPQSTRASSIKGVPQKGEVKRQPSMLRALLQSVRRPRCCSRPGPAAE